MPGVEGDLPGKTLRKNGHALRDKTESRLNTVDKGALHYPGTSFPLSATLLHARIKKLFGAGRLEIQH